MDFELINLLFIQFTNPSARTGYDTRSIFKRSFYLLFIGQKINMLQRGSDRRREMPNGLLVTCHNYSAIATNINIFISTIETSTTFTRAQNVYTAESRGKCALLDN